ncbi:glycine betaine ABC transporter substrate-binding protein [Pseudomonas caspiana]|uniref:Glycine/betaine ABC transporter substrate-binding protein n=1 Tax=Pseudomonas caspiana TaxID=1451454 RepID=A0A1Y3P7Y3_9PSED|nr:glycine betaine ABC transporter substrate-binding protein [Pseudomonas caspiana]OUM75930.1 glycine/betaine ABC transporter substrate-binding protein [Pseudomonas caspiana]
MKRGKHTFKFLLAGFALSLTSNGATAAEAASCETVRFGMMAWTDLAATTAVARTLFEDLGYKTTDSSASQPIIFGAMRDNRLDAFLGYWSPSADSIIEPFRSKAQVKVFDEPSLADGQMTLAVPTWLAEKGLRTFQDIHKFKKELGGKIYGIDPGTDINRRLQAAIDAKRFDLDGFKLVESSEAGMLSAVARAENRKEAIVLVGWKPHPMNIQFNLTYLTGSDGMMGADEGKATVWTVVRGDYAQQCPNAARLLSNLKFNSAQEAKMMGRILNREDPMKVARDFLDSNPGLVKEWLAGVTQYNGNAAAIAAN